MLTFDHIGVVVPTLSIGCKHLSALFEIEMWTDAFDDAVNGVSVQFGRDLSGICYEAIAPYGQESPISEALGSGSRILNHVAYLVPDLPAAAARLRAARCLPLGLPKPAIAYGGHPIQFFATPLKFIVELIEAPDHVHMYTMPTMPTNNQQP